MKSRIDLIMEMPWQNLDTQCPFCGTKTPNVIDYKVELWDLPLTFKIYFNFRTDKQAKHKFINKIMTSRKIPVLCSNPRCPEHVFTFDKQQHLATKEQPAKDIKELLVRNYNIIYSRKG